MGGALKRAATVAVVWAVLVFFTERPMGAKSEIQHPLLKLPPGIQRRRDLNLPPKLQERLAKRGVFLHGRKEGWTFPRPEIQARAGQRSLTGEIFEGDGGPNCFAAENPLYPPIAPEALGAPELLANRPAFVDIDGDNDLDVFLGTKYGEIRFYRNTGSATDPQYAEVTGPGNNPFDGVDVSDFAAPAFVDIDNDGDQDAFVGEVDGTIHFFRNTGSAAAPAFTEITGASNPFDLVDVGDAATPSFGRFDGDALFDAFVGSAYDGIHYFRNEGTAAVASFDEETGEATDPFLGEKLPDFTVPFLVDFDGDGDLDAFVGAGKYYSYPLLLGFTAYFENTAGTMSMPVGPDNQPLFFIGPWPAPALVDIDDDGDLDAFIGGKLDGPTYIENRGTALDPAFLDRGFSLDFADIDGDGDLDAFAGGIKGLSAFVNVGSATNPVWEHSTYSNPFGFASAYSMLLPTLTLGDMDGDGDLDAFVGEKKDGYYLRYFENTGTTAAPLFSEVIGAGNPMDGVALGDSEFHQPTLVDIDGDGDQDLFVATYESGAQGYIRFFRNDPVPNGTPPPPQVPVLTEVTGAGNPFDGVDPDEFGSLAFHDWDGDGDLDAFLGVKYDYTIRYFENTGSATGPVFTERSGLDNPAVGIFNFPSTPALADIDGDDRAEFVAGGDFDARFFLPLADVIVSPGPLATDEGGATDDFTVVLAHPPEGAQTVTLSLASNDPGEATVSSPTLVFNSANWNVPQVVTVTGQDDPLADGAQPFTITVVVDDAATTSPCYDPIAQRTVAGSNADVGEAAQSVLEIPTLSGWGTAALGGLLSLFGLRRLSRRRSAG